MPDYNFAPINVTPPQQTSLGDMLNIARGAQAYQQSQQLNPLQLQQQRELTEQARISTEKAKRTLEPEISRTESLADQAHIETMVKKFGLNKDETNEFNSILGGYANDKRLNPENLKNDPTGAVDVMNEIHEAAINKGIRKDRVNIISAPAIALASKNPFALSQYIENMKQAGLGAQGQVELTKPSIGTNAAGQTVSQNPITGKMEIMGTPQTNPTTSNVIEVNGIKYVHDPITKNLVQLREAQSTTPLTVPNSNAPLNEKQQGMPKLLQIDELRSPGQFNSQELDRYKLGAEDFNKIQQRSTLAQESALDAANIKRSLASASGGKPGQIMRDTGQALFGDPQKDLLVKNLAQNALRQSALMGVKNQAAEGDVKTANGSEQITAEALAHIVERIESTNLAAQKYNQALIKLQEKHGKDKAYLNNDNFKAAWGSAYDPVAFIIQNTNRQNIPQKDKDKIIDYYTRDMSQDKLDALHDSQVKLKRLERGDF